MRRPRSAQPKPLIIPMLERLFLHIGVEKTGTKTLQLAMDVNRDLLQRHGFVYPTLPGPPHHRGLVLYAADELAISHMRPLAGLADGDLYGEFIEQFPSRLAAALSVPDTKTAILSNEDCSSRLTTVEEIARLYDLLSRLARECRIIVYLRRQDELAASRYSSNIKAGHINSVEADEEPYWYDYQQLLDRWAAVFGPDRLTVRIFEPRQLYEGDLLADFSFAIGFEQHKLLQRPPNQNQSLDIRSLEFLRRFNMHVPVLVDGQPNASRGPIVEAITAASTSERLMPTAEAATAFLEKFAASNAEVARKYLKRADGVLFMDRVSAERRALGPSLEVDQAIEIAAKLWQWQEARFQKRQRSE